MIVMLIAYARLNELRRQSTRVQALPGFRPGEGQSGAGPRYPLPKIENSSYLGQYFSVLTNQLFVFFFSIKFYYIFPLMGAWLPERPWLRP